jgi:TonB family protein
MLYLCTIKLKNVTIMTRGKSILSELKTIRKQVAVVAILAAFAAFTSCSPMYDELTPNEVKPQTRIFVCCPEEMPKFPGGHTKLMEFLSENVRWPKDLEDSCIQGRVVVSFVIERDGSITEVKVSKSVDPLLDAEAVRVVKLMPKWMPGKLNGEAKRTKYYIPVNFRLQ